MPLEQLRPRPVNIPRSKDAIPIVEKITFDRLYDRAFQQVFGKTVICPDLAIAAQYARTHNVDGITYDGDTTSKRGAMTGGYVDPGRSRLNAVRSLKKFAGRARPLMAQAREIESRRKKRHRPLPVPPARSASSARVYGSSTAASRTCSTRETTRRPRWRGTTPA